MSYYSRSNPHPRHRKNPSNYYFSGRKKCRIQAGGNSAVREGTLLHSLSPSITFTGTDAAQSQRRVISGRRQAMPGGIDHARRMKRAYRTYIKRKAWDFRHSRQTRSKAANVAPRNDPVFQMATFSSSATRAEDQRVRKATAKKLVPQLVKVYKTDHFGENHIQRDLKDPKKKWLQKLTLEVCAADLLDHVLKWVRPEQFVAEVITQSKKMSPLLLTVICAYVAPGIMRTEVNFGSSKTAPQPSAKFAGVLATQPMGTFASGFGVAKVHYTQGRRRKRKNSQEASMYYPLVHMLMFRWFASQLTSEYMAALQHDQAYITVLLNCWSRLHGGSHNRENKIPIVNGHDSLVTHVGQFFGGHFITRLTPAQVVGVGGVGQLGKCVRSSNEDLCVDCSHYEWGSPEFVPTTGDLAESFGGVAAGKMYTVSARNVVLATTSNNVHGSTDFVLDTAGSMNPAKFTVVCSVRGSGKGKAFPDDKDTVAVFSNGNRVNHHRRPQMPPIRRLTYHAINL